MSVRSAEGVLPAVQMCATSSERVERRRVHCVSSRREKALDRAIGQHESACAAGAVAEIRSRSRRIPGLRVRKSARVFGSPPGRHGFDDCATNGLLGWSRSAYAEPLGPQIYDLLLQRRDLSSRFGEMPESHAVLPLMAGLQVAHPDKMPPPACEPAGEGGNCRQSGRQARVEDFKHANQLHFGDYSSGGGAWEWKQAHAPPFNIWLAACRVMIEP
jgi:hypothetical protein